MKRFFLCLLALMLCLSTTASAAGLGGLGGLGGGLGGLVAPAAEPNGVLPDPADTLGSEGTVLMEDYQFSAGYLCTAYTYPMPADMSQFIASYGAAAEANGYTVTEETVDGLPGYRIALAEGPYALMVPDFQGVLLLLVQKDMAFGEAAPEGYYLKVTRNGREMMVENPECEESTRLTGTSKSFEITAFFDRAEIYMFEICFPNYAQAGDEYKVTNKSLIDGISFYADKDGGLLVYHDTGNKMDGPQDYFRVKITDMYRDENNYGTVIEGNFDASFRRGELTYTDGEFRVLCYD